MLRLRGCVGTEDAVFPARGERARTDARGHTSGGRQNTPRDLRIKEARKTVTALERVVKTTS